MCAGACISVSSKFSANSSNHSGRSRRRSFEFSESLAGFRDQLPAASSLLLWSMTWACSCRCTRDESCDGDVEDELDNPGTTKGTKLSVFHKMYFPCLVNRGLMTGRQAYLRVIALSRRDQDRERIPVLPRLFALPHWPVPPLWGFWISVKYPFHLTSSPFCSACASTLRSQPRILSPLGFLKVGASAAIISFVSLAWIRK